jgi:hypothetical protein
MDGTSGEINGGGDCQSRVEGGVDWAVCNVSASTMPYRKGEQGRACRLWQAKPARATLKDDQGQGTREEGGVVRVGRWPCLAILESWNPCYRRPLHHRVGRGNALWLEWLESLQSPSEPPPSSVLRMGDGGWGMGDGSDDQSI